MNRFFWKYLFWTPFCSNFVRYVPETWIRELCHRCCFTGSFTKFLIIFTFEGSPGSSAFNGNYFTSFYYYYYYFFSFLLYFLKLATFNSKICEMFFGILWWNIMNLTLINFDFKIMSSQKIDLTKICGIILEETKLKDTTMTLMKVANNIFRLKNRV